MLSSLLCSAQCPIFHIVLSALSFFLSCRSLCSVLCPLLQSIMPLSCSVPCLSLPFALALCPAISHFLSLLLPLLLPVSWLHLALGCSALFSLVLSFPLPCSYPISASALPCPVLSWLASCHALVCALHPVYPLAMLSPVLLICILFTLSCPFDMLCTFSCVMSFALHCCSHCHSSRFVFPPSLPIA